MNTTEIEGLLSKYYEGETSREEEILLEKYFLETDVPPHLRVHAAQFRFAQSSREEGITDPAFDSKVLDRIAATEERSGHPFSRRFVYLTTLAATLLLLGGIIFTFRQEIRNSLSPEQRSEQYTSPETAYAEATKALLLVSVNLNTGLEQMGNIRQFNKGLEQIQPLTNFSKFQSISLNRDDLNNHPIKK